ncbi:hypothetical protein CEXT_232521 [Caerostris extrusa]|uniref:Uncharacterized protein n=1 Tax=Caerostris extrusa TaxID=172846 RepID=A0AAV4X8R5_CAEEX|nr:hypothetical protein CEXT_232521 [Caerostris extrusa]
MLMKMMEVMMMKVDVDGSDVDDDERHWPRLTRENPVNWASLQHERRFRNIVGYWSRDLEKPRDGNISIGD